MAVPKSVVRINKDGVHMESNVERTAYTITELSRAALRDVARLLRRRIKEAAPVDTGNLRRNVGSWVRSTKGNEVPFLQVGVYDKERAHKKGLQHAFYAPYLELGSSRQDAVNHGQGFIRPTVMSSVDDIRRIQGQYLSAIEEENKALGLIDEDEEVADD